MYLELVDCKKEEVPFQLIKSFTKECFFYKDVNTILREVNDLSEEIFAEKFKDLVSYYFMFLKAQRFFYKKK